MSTQFCHFPQAWSETAGQQTPQPAALPAPAPEPQFSHPVPPPPAERTKEEHPAEPYTLSPGAAVAIAAAQLAEHPTQRGSAAAAEGLPAADPVMVRLMLLAARESSCISVRAGFGLT